MASLISYKSSSNAYPDRKMKYIIRFTIVNIIFLAFLMAYWYLNNLIFHNNNSNNNNGSGDFQYQVNNSTEIHTGNTE